MRSRGSPQKEKCINGKPQGTSSWRCLSRPDKPSKPRPFNKSPIEPSRGRPQPHSQWQLPRPKPEPEPP